MVWKICHPYYVGRWKNVLISTSVPHHRINNGSETLIPVQISETLAKFWCIWKLFLTLLWVWLKNSIWDAWPNPWAPNLCFADKADTETKQDFEADREQHSLPIAWHTDSMSTQVKPCNVHDGAETQSLKCPTLCLTAVLCAHQWDPLYHNFFIHNMGKIEFQHTIVRKLINADEHLYLLIQNPLLIEQIPAPVSTFCEIFWWVICDFGFLSKRDIIKAS